VTKTLYLLRKPLDRIDPALFLPSESRGDVVLLEEGGVTHFPYPGGEIYSVGDRRGAPGLSYERLVEMIFESDHTVVI
jgi:hypothetical protein